MSALCLQIDCRSGTLAVKWKLWTRNENNSPPDEGSHQYDWEDAALERACALMRQQPHVKVLYIERPNGERIDSAAIEAWCKSRPPVKRTARIAG